MIFLLFKGFIVHGVIKVDLTTQSAHLDLDLIALDFCVFRESEDMPVRFFVYISFFSGHEIRQGSHFTAQP